MENLIKSIIESSSIKFWEEKSITNSGIAVLRRTHYLDGSWKTESGRKLREITVFLSGEYSSSSFEKGGLSDDGQRVEGGIVTNTHKTKGGDYSFSSAVYEAANGKRSVITSFEENELFSFTNT